MRIAAIADLHFTEERRPRAEAIAGAVAQAGADVLVIAGDCAEGVERLPDALALFGEFSGVRLMVPGNHDLWQDTTPFETRRLYEQTIPAIAADCGFHCLDSEPLVIDGTCFVGGMGWYDYQMRQCETPSPGITVTPITVTRGEAGKMHFSSLPDARETGWEALEPRDYAANGLVWQANGDRPQVAVWSDPLHLDWGAPAEQVAEEMAARIRAQIRDLAGGCSRVVGVTHFVPFSELASHHLENPRRAYARAFLGSPLLGEALLEAENLALVIHGHRHRQEARRVHGIVVADASVTGAQDGPLLFTLPD